MTTVLPETQNVSPDTIVSPGAASPSVAVSDTPPVDQSLGVGSQQAPEPTVGDTASSTPGNTETQQVSYEQFKALQDQLNEREDMLAQIRKVAEEQRRQAEQQQFQASLRERLQGELKRVVDSGDEEQITERVYGFLSNVLGEVERNYQSQLSQYEQDVQQAFWAATMPGFADDLVRKHNLPPEVKSDLLQFKTEGEMTTYALRVKAAIGQFQQQQQQQAIQQQGQERRESGVNAIGGVTGGPLPHQPLQPGSSRELMPALRSILGM